ncbi:MAG: adaptor protein MecA [Turicibacter sp.]|nr:adaptor protein MecA [Turicibacter sp.]
MCSTGGINTGAGIIRRLRLVGGIASALYKIQNLYYLLIRRENFEE